MVYVLNKNGTPLQPCRNARARILLKEGKAKVVRRTHFTIKLNYDVKLINTKELILKVDTGSSHVGVAVCNTEGDVYFMSQVELRNDIKRKMDQRRAYRRNRRNRKTRYRPCRFLNRGNSKRKGRLTPTVNSKINSHIKIINLVIRMMPITKIVIETTDFDIQAIDHPDVLGGRGVKYQQSKISGFDNAKAFIRNRDNYKCQNPKCEHKGDKNVRLEVHHKTFKRNGGDDNPSNLVTLCEHCHHDLHNNGLDIKFKKPTTNKSKGATETNVIGSQLPVKLLEQFLEKGIKIPIFTSFGFATRINRRRLGLYKTHYFDAVAIANDNDSVVFRTNDVFIFKCVSDGNYQCYKGQRSEIKMPKDKIEGFKRYDKVLYKGKEYFIKGRMSTGYAILMDIYEVKQDLKPMPKFKTMKRLTARTTWMCTRMSIITHLGDVSV